MRRAFTLILAVGMIGAWAVSLASAQKKGYFVPAKRHLLPNLEMEIGWDPSRQYPFIIAVEKGSDAKIYGIKPGDEILRFQGREVRNQKRFVKDVERLRPRSKVDLWLRRGARTYNVKFRTPASPGQAKRRRERAEKKAERKRQAQARGGKDKKAASRKKRSAIVIKPIPRNDDSF